MINELNNIKLKKERYLFFFNNHKKFGINFIETICLCKKNMDFIISKTDACGFRNRFVICFNCGLIRAKDFLDETSLNIFYRDFYTKIFREDFKNPEQMYEAQKLSAKEKFDIINLYIDKYDKDDIIIDFGGCTGGTLDHLKEKSKCYLIDFDEKYLKFAMQKGINTIFGSINEMSKLKNFKLIILSHVVEHIVDLDIFLKKLNQIVSNETLIYFEFPAIDSLKLGRSANLKSDLHIPHIYYFTSLWIKNYFEVNGFEILYIDKFCKIIVKKNSEYQSSIKKNCSYDSLKQILLGNIYYNLRFSNFLQKKFVKHGHKHWPTGIIN